MNRFITAAIATVALALYIAPVSAQSGQRSDTIQIRFDEKSSTPTEPNFESDFGKKFNGRFKEEFYSGLDSK